MKFSPFTLAALVWLLVTVGAAAAAVAAVAVAAVIALQQ